MIGNLNKKIVLFFLSLLPLIGFGQDFDFHDIKKIDSEESFKKFVLENLFRESGEPLDTNSRGLPLFITYGYNMIGEPPNEAAECWAYYYYYPSNVTFHISFSLNSEKANSTFEKIVNQIKSECTFYRIEFNEIYYSCPKSKYKGKISFWKDEENGHIRTLIIDPNIFRTKY